MRGGRRAVVLGLWCGVSGCAGVTPPGPAPDGGCQTIVTGVAMAPNGADPLPGVSVYLPRTPPPEFPAEIACEGCVGPGEDQQAALARAVSGADGRFTLQVPTPSPSPAIIQLYLQRGRWRRRLSVPVAACQQTRLDRGEAHLPRDRGEGDLPRMAVGVGDFDAIECVLRHIGVSPGEFTAPDGAGSVHLYEAEGRTSGGAPGGVPLIGLLQNPAALRRYQFVLLNCTEASQIQPLLLNPLVRADLLDYVAAGGRLYVSDWMYNLLAQQPAWSPYLCFEGDTCPPGNSPVFQAAALGLPRGFDAQAQPQDLQAWLGLPQIGLPGGKLPITSLLFGWALLQGVPPDQTRYPSTVWLRGVTNGADRPLTVTFDYPRGQACGRVLYSSHHTRGHVAGGVFPTYCPADGVIPQERVLEYLLFQATSCVPPLG